MSRNVTYLVHGIKAHLLQHKARCCVSYLTEEDLSSVGVAVQTCALYPNGKPPNEQMFVANAALWYSTGSPAYHQAADKWYQDSDDFAPSWNNVGPQVCTHLISRKGFKSASIEPFLNSRITSRGLIESTQ
jgi:hypothetical protein